MHFLFSLNSNSLIWNLIGCILIAMIFHIQGCGNHPLEPWHNQKLTAEFTTKKASKIRTFNAYKQLENEVFSQLEEKISKRIKTGPEYKFARYSSGSSADPRRRTPNWNRSFELPADEPLGGVLLLHGMSDSPYSLRALGQTLKEHKYWVVAPRLPGHGTIPSGLKYIDWKDMAIVVQLGINHLVSKVGQKPIHIVGYSTGAALAIDFTLNALLEKSAPIPASLVLISPAVGIHPIAALAGVKNGLSIIPGFGHFAWNSIHPEFDPYKYNSFATNAGTQVHRITKSVARRIASLSNSDLLAKFPPLLVFKSTVDATVSSNAVIDELLKPLGPYGHELVLFDINRIAAQTTLLVNDPGPLTDKLMSDENLPFTFTLITNENSESRQVITRRKKPFSGKVLKDESLNLVWPAGVISLSHVALSFPPDDPLYGRWPPDTKDIIFLGQIAIKGERDLLKISNDWLLRMRYNPFYDFLERRSLAWISNIKKTEK
jgi:alpha-beta hydrolase superfamily lysophospholipase